MPSAQPWRIIGDAMTLVVPTTAGLVGGRPIRPHGDRGLD
jgi:hypothetical protein